MSIRQMLCASVALSVVAVVSASALQAETFEYAWSGQLIPTASEDPWSLGPSGAPFDLRVLAQSDADDRAPLDLKFAAFAASAADLSIGGQSVEYTENGVLDFTDNNAQPGHDSVIFGGWFKKNDVVLLISTLVGFSSFDVFTFTQDDAPLPVFPSTNDVLQSISIDFPYKAVVAAQTLVTVRIVPEPSACMPFALGLAFLRWRRPRVAQVAVGCCLLMAVLTEQSLSATPITYSWSGFVAPVGAEDPLLLGPTLTPYTLDATIPDLSAPIMSRQVGFAAFDLSSIRLIVDGREFSTPGAASIHFTDKQSIFEGIYAGLGLSDSMSVGAEVSYAGADWLFPSIVAISSDTFFFPTETSLPPLFPPLEAIDEGSSKLSLPNSLGGFDVVYQGLGRATCAATVVPEPATLLLASASFFACFAIHFCHRNS